MPENDQPRLSVLRGDPDDSELAALLVALAGRPSHVDGPVAPRRPAAARWQASGYRPPTSWSAPRTSW